MSITWYVLAFLYLLNQLNVQLVFVFVHGLSLHHMHTAEWRNTLKIYHMSLYIHTAAHWDLSHSVLKAAVTGHHLPTLLCCCCLCWLDILACSYTYYFHKCRRILFGRDLPPTMLSNTIHCRRRWILTGQVLTRVQVHYCVKPLLQKSLH